MSTDNHTMNKPNALELGTNEVKESHPLDAENFPHCYFSTRSEKWIVKNTIQNLEYFLNYHRIKTRLNEMTYQVEIEMGGYFEYSAKNIDHFVVIKSLLAESNYDKILNVNDYATQIAIKNMYHPVRDWITSKPLTTTGNIKRIVDALNPVNLALAQVLVTKWLVSGIRAWFCPEGVAAQGALILHGKQGTRKTSFLKSLLPTHMIQEGHTINLNKKDSEITALAYAITELGEIMASIKKTGNDELKAFITKERDAIRVPYGRVDTIRPRRTIFCGTVNNDRFLSDDTGSRRFWTVSICESSPYINTEHGVNMQQLWAEAKSLYDNGYLWYLTSDEEQQLEASNKEHEIENPMEELILQTYNWNSDCVERKTETDILADFEIAPASPKFKENKRLLRQALIKLEIPKFKSGSIRGFIMPKAQRNIINM